MHSVCVQPVSVRRLCMRRLVIACLIGSSISPTSLRGAEFVLSEFNSSGFNYTFSGFEQTPGPASVRVFDPLDDSGGAGISQSLNLSSHADSRFVVDLSVNASNAVDFFDLELIDSAGRTGKWSLGVSDLTPGVPSTLVATTTLDNPTHGVGDFNNLDLNNITTWQVLGSFSSSNAFDINFDRVVVTDMVEAPPAYPGAEPDAPWRAEAAARIATNRKAGLQVNVTDAMGNPIHGATVSVKMTDHEFGFGSAVQAFRLRNSHPQHDTYKQMTSDLFNAATIENNLKWPPWEGEWGGNFTQSGAQNAVNWLNGEGIDVRGHAMVWPGYTNLPQPIKNMLDGAPLNAAEQTALRDAIAAHIADIGGAFAGQLAAWDVVNEERANHDIMDNLAEGDLAMVDWFQQAQAVDPAAKRYINDFGILTSAGGTNTSNQQEYFDTIQALINNGAPVEGIGFQSHFNEGSLTGPEQLWKIIDRFATLGLDMQITEFDFTTSDEQLQADFTRDFLTAMFAHEGIDDFLFWGFWEDAHWRPDAALFRSDWSIKPNGQAYLDLVFDEWWTDEIVETALGGTATVDGFKGDYEITVTYNGQSHDAIATLTDGGMVVDIALPTLSADFDGDGDVDDADLAIWSSNLGTLTGAMQSTGDADGDGDIDGRDFLLWQSQNGTTIAAVTAAVPEPTSVALLLLASCVGLQVRRR